VFILIYFRLYSIQAVQGLLFGMSQPQANEWVHRLAPFFNTALDHERRFPAHKPCNLDEVLGECEGLEFIIDRVEHPIQRVRVFGSPQDAWSSLKVRFTASVEQPRDQGSFTNRFLGEWTYIGGFGAGRCRGVGCRGKGAAGQERVEIVSEMPLQKCL
jgi:hypothetical protein